jgi:polysaccharide deacetylase family protein (PEP-CTERM system associated)
VNRPSKQTNILQIDVEDWYADLDVSTWKFYEDRIVKNTNRILDILKEKNVQATFFVVGYVADHHPELIERIIDESHEIGSHGYSHKRITELTPAEFEDDLRRSIRTIEKISRSSIIGFRAPTFTVTEKTAWAIDIMKRLGLKYDSSIFPVKTHLYGIPDAKLDLYYPSSENIKEDDPTENFLEVPLSVYPLPTLNYNIPVAGGFYLRFLPYTFNSHAIRKINNARRPAVCYIHPWEIDPGQPRISSFEWYHYYNLSGMEKRFRKLVSDFTFTSTSDYIASA